MEAEDVVAYELEIPTRAVSSSPFSKERGWYTFPTFTRREVALMGKERGMKVLRFVLCLLLAALLLAYIAPVKAC